MHAGVALLTVLLAAQSESTTLSVDWTEPTDAASGNVCWLAPRKGTKAQLERLLRAIEVAAKGTQPGHTRYELLRIKSPKKEGAACKVIVDFTLQPKDKVNGELIFAATERGAPAPIVETTLSLDLEQLTEKDLNPGWEKVWAAIAPPKPEPPPPPPIVPPPAPFVDQEIVAERQTLAPEVEPESKRKWAALMLSVGMLSRSLDGAPGTPIDGSSLLSLGAEGALHLDRVFGLGESHELELGAGYLRRLANGARGEEAVSVSADRLQAGLVYRFHTGEGYLPRVGPLAGYELLRFELGAAGDAFSVRYSVIRGGLSVVQPVVLFDGGAVLLGVDGALRLAPSAAGGDAGTSFDVGGGPRLELAGGFLAQLRARYARQSGRAGDAEFTDGYFDLDLGIGWAL